MLFGDQADFAIEADVEPDLTPPTAVWGHMCVWCRGAALGDINDLCCALYPAYLGFRELPDTLDGLWAEQLAGLDDEAVYHFLDQLLYGSSEATEAECLRDVRLWGRFNFLTNWGEQFDGYPAFILSPPGGGVRILSRRFPDNLGGGVEVTRAGVLGAIEGFTRWFEEQERRLQGGSGSQEPP